MAKWYELAKEEYRTISTCLPKELVPLLDMHRENKSRSRYIRTLIEADIEEREMARENATPAA